jgi:hypothetical protein
MLASLQLHHDNQAAFVRGIEVEIARPDLNRLTLRYRLTGDLGQIVYPPPAAPARADNLWRHTCFEAFIGLPAGGYLEYNLAPSRQWAAYRFDGYRHGIRPAEVADPHIAIAAQGGLILTAEIDIPPDADRLGLAAVIEARNGTKSYWAIAHAPGHPDFHHRDCFALELPAVEGA